MELNLRVTSWIEPMEYVINDLAYPPTNIKLLMEFIDENTSLWNHPIAFKNFRQYLTRLLVAFETSLTVPEFTEKTVYFP